MGLVNAHHVRVNVHHVSAIRLDETLVEQINMNQTGQWGRDRWQGGQWGRDRWRGG